MSKQIEAMKKLGFTDEEIQQMLADDKRIDRGEKLFELSAEQAKVSKEARQADRAPRVYDLDNSNGKRNKKADADKAFLVNALMIGLCDCIGMDANEISIANAEREFSFTYKDRKFKVVLSCPRS